ncbi:MAG: hypothetical protein J2P25_19635 [Nocardiopsaceae bacterium]|nr:hypothetical protein [Nocardiopsaceae bacterium]
MTAYDAALDDLAERIRKLSARALAGLFWACSTALLPEAVAWAEHQGKQPGPALARGLAAARQFAATGAPPDDPRQLLHSIEAATPSGDAPGYYSPGNAQDCWVCADVCIRVLTDPGYDPGPAIEYALEPVVAMATQELFGVSQVGSGDQEEARVIAIMRHPRTVEAIMFCQWATGFLEERPSPAAADLAAVANSAAALRP